MKSLWDQIYVDINWSHYEKPTIYASLRWSPEYIWWNREPILWLLDYFLTICQFLVSYKDPLCKAQANISIRQNKNPYSSVNAVVASLRFLKFSSNANRKEEHYCHWWLWRCQGKIYIGLWLISHRDSLAETSRLLFSIFSTDGESIVINSFTKRVADNFDVKESIFFISKWYGWRLYAFAKRKK